MKRMIASLGALLLVGSVAVAVSAAGGHNLLVIRRSDLAAVHKATPSPAAPAGDVNHAYPVRPVRTPTPVSTPYPTPSLSPSPTPAPSAYPTPQPEPFTPAPLPSSTPTPVHGCGTCGGFRPGALVMCPQYCVN